MVKAAGDTSNTLTSALGDFKALEQKQGTRGQKLSTNEAGLVPLTIKPAAAQ